MGVYVQSPGLTDCAEKCVEAFNSLAESELNEICSRIIDCARENVINEEFELPVMDNVFDILNYCWFTAVYVNMLSSEDEIAYVVEGEGDWGEVIGFAVKNDKVIYVGTDYFEYMEDGQ